MVFSTSEWDPLAKIRQHGWKSVPHTISQVAKFKCNLLKTSKDIATQTRWILQRFYGGGCFVPRLLSLKRARKGRREGDCTLPMVPCGSSPITRFALASTLPCEKRSARGGGCGGSIFVPPTRQTSGKFRDFVDQYLRSLWTYLRKVTDRVHFKQIVVKVLRLSGTWEICQALKF